MPSGKFGGPRPLANSNIALTAKVVSTVNITEDDFKQSSLTLSLESKYDGEVLDYDFKTEAFEDADGGVKYDNWINIILDRDRVRDKDIDDFKYEISEWLEIDYSNVSGFVGGTRPEGVLNVMRPLASYELLYVTRFNTSVILDREEEYEFESNLSVDSASTVDSVTGQRSEKVPKNEIWSIVRTNKLQYYEIKDMYETSSELANSIGTELKDYMIVVNGSSI